MVQTIPFKKVPLFSDLPPNDVDYLGATLQVVKLGPGEVLFCECEPGDGLYIILESQLEVCGLSAHPMKDSWRFLVRVSSSAR
jgi:CRP-like cAMP-binding protein